MSTLEVGVSLEEYGALCGGRRGWRSTWYLYMRVGRRDFDQAAMFCLRILALTALSLRLTKSHGQRRHACMDRRIGGNERLEIRSEMRASASLQIDVPA